MTRRSLGAAVFIAAAAVASRVDRAGCSRRRRCLLFVSDAFGSPSNINTVRAAAAAAAQGRLRRCGAAPRHFAAAPPENGNETKACQGAGDRCPAAATALNASVLNIYVSVFCRKSTREAARYLHAFGIIILSL